MFAGWSFPETAVESALFADIGYRLGVPMGGDLIASEETIDAPQLLVRAVKDPHGANLDRIQIVKGWLDSAGNTHEHVFDVAWSDGRRLDAQGVLPAVGNTVDLTSARYTNTIGAPELSILWRDPDFNPAQQAFYYARVMQIPTPRNGLFDALALGLDAPPKGPKVLQERAYTSPIWYQP